ncbi:MAG: fatty acid--CoA ligase [Minwuia sp.]|uniref:fatty acid--CoA ligase n=1 Tax=Minwuia sp. TaxID=2493630 RepID=UPI003A895088
MPMTNVADVLRGHAKTRPDDVATVFRDRSSTYADLDRYSNRVANGLIALGVKPGQRVALLTKNCDQFMELYYGCAKAGAVIVPVNFRLAGPEIAYIVNDAGAEVFFVGEGYADLAAEQMGAMPKVREVFSLTGEGGYPAYFAWRDSQDDTDPMIAVDPESIASQLYSSGTTGHPKGVQLSHQSGLNLWPLLADPNESAYGRWSEDDVNLVCMPLYHVGGLNNALAGMYVGAKTVILADAIPADILRTIPEHRVTKTFLVPALILFLVQSPGVREVDFSSMDEIWYGAAPIPVELLKQAIEIFGPVFGQAYGMTESNGGGVYMPKEDHDLSKPDRLKSCGKPAPGYDVKVVDDDANELPAGEVGEIILRSNTLMAGYWNLPEATAKTLKDGWLWSGDAGFFDAEGFLYIHDRVKDMIISGGENIYPAEIESALYGHPAIADVAVIGVPDDRWGEAVKAVIVKAKDADLSEGEVIDYARSRIAHYKCPKSVDFIAELPRNATGKILKRELRKPYWEGRDRGVS